MEEIATKIVAGERRLTMLLVGHWQEARGGRRCPLASDLLAAVPADLLEDCFLYVPGRRAGAGEIRDIGAKIGAASGLAATSLRRKKVPEETLLGVACKWVDHAIEQGGPVVDEGEFATPEGPRRLYRATLLPLEDGDGKITRVLGGARSKAGGETD